MILLYFSLKVADISLSESGHLVPWWLTPHIHMVFELTGKKKAPHGEAFLNDYAVTRSYTLASNPLYGRDCNHRV
jgi:hypothetical protein